MNSEERIKAALYFKSPDKVPVFQDVRGDVCPLLAQHSQDWTPGWNEGEEHLFPHARVGYVWEKPPWAKENLKYENEKWKTIPHEEIDEWGCIWNMRGKDTNMGHPGRAPIKNWDEYDEFIKKYNPDPMDESRYNFALELKKSFGENKYRMGHIADFGPFQRASTIRGFSNFLIDHRKNPEMVRRSLKRETDWHVDAMKACYKYELEPHGFWIVDDLGEQTGPFFSPKTFEEFYKPVYKTICDEAHQLGAEVHLHCCGKIDRLLPLLIEWGLDAIELDSPRMSGYPELRQFRGKIMYWACVNIQSIYTRGSPDEVEREVWHMIRNLGTKNGGFGAYFYPTPTDLNAPKQNIKAFQKGLKKYGNYSKLPKDWWEYPPPDEWDDFIVPPLPPISS
ncbi:MAG: Methylcobalamin:coenzyme M methyltransferase (modular protein) [Promethearchaeota archaeon]|nr:MAG: Methylcobalamin:coenzyme M methyltransferase (modular protein) [Candidatus Lokiarchaeota archaeon]